MDGLEDILCSKEELQQIVKKRSDAIFILGLIAPRRPGVFLFVRTLELRYYKPGTPRNDLFDCKVFELGGEIIQLALIIPQVDYHLAIRLAQECGLHMKLGEMFLVQPDAGSRPADWLRNAEHSGLPDGRTYVLENLPGHAAYGNSPDQIRALLESEDMLIAMEEQRFLHDSKR